MRLNVADNIRRGMRAAFQFPSGNTGSGAAYGSPSWYEGTGWWFGANGQEINYAVQAGPLHTNSIIYNCLQWCINAFVEAPVCAQRRVADEWQIINDHPAIDLLDAPSIDSDGALLWSDALFSLYLNGNAYFFKQRSAAGAVVGLEWMPHWLVEPRWPIAKKTTFISHYDYRVDGVTQAVPRSEVIHLRHGIRDPGNIRKSLSPMSAMLRLVCTDNEADVFSEAMLRNRGVPGVVLSPKEKLRLTEGQREGIIEKWTRKFTGASAGTPFVSDTPFDVTVPGFSPEQLVMDKVRTIPEQRIPSAFGIPCMVVGFNAGEGSKTYANYEQAVESAYDSGICPLQVRLSRQLTQQLMYEFEASKRKRIWFDSSKVRALQEDTDRVYTRNTQAVGGPWITVNEARRSANLLPLQGPAADELVKPAAPPGPDDEQDPQPDDEESK